MLWFVIIPWNEKEKLFSFTNNPNRWSTSYYFLSKFCKFCLINLSRFRFQKLWEVQRLFYRKARTLLLYYFPKVNILFAHSITFSYVVWVYHITENFYLPSFHLFSMLTVSINGTSVLSYVYFTYLIEIFYKKYAYNTGAARSVYILKIIKFNEAMLAAIKIYLLAGVLNVEEHANIWIRVSATIAWYNLSVFNRNKGDFN